MNKASSDAALLAISLDRNLAEPLQAQLARALRRLILERRIGAGGKLPSSRLLAEELSVSRVTVTAAIDQIVSEGYAEGRRGSGVYVAAHLPDYPPAAPARREVGQGATSSATAPVRAFEPAAPDLENFPFRDWARLCERVWRAPDPALLGKADPFGWTPLRAAIARHLGDWRGVACDASQIVITAGASDAVELIAAAALAPGAAVLVEEPGYEILRRALIRNRLDCRPCPVDDQGFEVGRALAAHRDAKAVAVTPSRHFPLGMTLPLARRLALLDWARRTGGYVIEDDFDSEYRFQGQPLPALTSLDDGERVIYVGSFSKTMMIGLRLGFVALPPALIEPARAAMDRTGPRASLMAQPVLAAFMDDGGFATHIRRMRRLYAKRQARLLAAAAAELGGLLEPDAAPAGMHVIADLAPALARRMDDAGASARAASAGVVARALSGYYAGPARRRALVLGFAAFDEAAIDAGVRKLRAALD